MIDYFFEMFPPIIHLNCYSFFGVHVKNFLVLVLLSIFSNQVIGQGAELKKNGKIVPNVRGSENIEIFKNRLYSQRKSFLKLLRDGASRDKVDKAQANIQKLEMMVSDLEFQTKKMRPSNLESPKSRFSAKGHLQFRTETARNLRGSQGVRQTEQSFFRLRSYVKYKANQKLNFTLTPQATKGFGGNDSNGTSTSGSTEHTELDFFEANFDYSILPKVSIKVGRQAVSYGDELVVGTLPWSNTGRSFDAIKMTYKGQLVSTEVLFSKTDDNSTPSLSTDDQNFLSLYNSFSFGPLAKELDLYFMQLRSGSAGGTEVNSFGFRLKGEALGLFYRTENSIQNGANLGGKAFQLNAELGKKFKKIKASVEYAIAGPDYRQFFPTGHKFLGFADVLGRRNIKQLAIHLWSKPLNWLSFNIDYHSFKRQDSTKSAFRLNGATAIGSTGLSNDIGSEFDFIMTFHSKSKIKLQLGSTWFSPGEYMRDQDTLGRDKVVNFNYVQVLAAF